MADKDKQYKYRQEIQQVWAFPSLRFASSVRLDAFANGHVRLRRCIWQGLGQMVSEATGDPSLVHRCQFVAAEPTCLRSRTRGSLAGYRDGFASEVRPGAGTDLSDPSHTSMFWGSISRLGSCSPHLDRHGPATDPCIPCLDLDTPLLTLMSASTNFQFLAEPDPREVIADLAALQMMYVSGETAEPSLETTGIIEDIVRQQVVEIVSLSP